MPFSLSPAVLVQEQDLTGYVPAVATDIGAIVGQFQWGPVEERTRVTNEADLVRIFEKPNNVNYKDFFSAANYLAYANNLLVVRVVGTGALNSGDASGYLVKNRNDFDNNLAAIEASTNKFLAKYPGVKGDNISVSVADAANYVGWAYENEFSYAPTGDQFWMVVLYNGSIVEKFTLDRNQGTFDDAGQPMYAPEAVNSQSDYVWLIEANLITSTDGVFDPITGDYTLTGGADGTAITDADRQIGWDLFANPQDVDVNYLISGGASQIAAEYMLDNVATARKDCIGFVSPQESDVVGNATPETAIITTRNAFNSTTYGVMDGNYKKQYDKYNAVYHWVPFNGDIAGLVAQVSFTNDPWWSPAGYNRGFIKNVAELAWNPAKANRDALYKIGINPIIDEAGEGVILFGDKTMTSKPSAFGFINVRQLFIVIEKAIATAAKYSLFEFNDAFTRNQFKQMVEPYLRRIQGARGIQQFRVVTDETVNTPAVVDAGEFVAEIFVSPARTIQNILLKFTATPTGVNFDELTIAG